jgi:hypothetical protein
MALDFAETDQNAPIVPIDDEGAGMKDMPPTAYAQIDAVLDLTHQELAEIERDLKSLTERQAQLREFLRLGNALHPWFVASIEPKSRCAPTAVGTSVPPRPLAPVRQTAARQAEDVLRSVQHPMRVEEIYRHIEARGTQKGKQSQDALRTAMRDHPDVFRRVERGLYGLVVWAHHPVAVGQ